MNLPRQTNQLVMSTRPRHQAVKLLPFVSDVLGAVDVQSLELVVGLN